MWCLRQALSPSLLAGPAIASWQASSLLVKIGQKNFQQAVSYSSSTSLLRFCVVGTGPAGLYTAERLIKKFGDGVRIDLLDRLPTPFGLVRSGVAPDHQDTKNVTNQFTEVAQDPRCSFLGNVNVGKDISLAELRKLYHGVVLAYGAESDRRLNIPGEDIPGVFSAREFVWWYNGHPDAKDLPVDLSKVRSVAVCGIGNVALDCARVLLRPVDQLAVTDIAGHTLAQLRGSSRVQEVHLVARRGPVQAACTPKELKELVSEPSISTLAPPAQMALSPGDQAEVKAVRMKRRVVEIISQAAAKGVRGDKQLHFQFYRNPVEILPDPATGHVGAVKVEITELRSEPGKPAVAVGTGKYETIPAQMVLKSIGYKSLPIEGLPFDSRQGVVPNVAGRVLREVKGADVDPGLYVCGWLKRGPTGIIGTNLVDAEETVGSMAEDVAAGRLSPPTGASSELPAMLASQGVRPVAFAGWRVLDAEEVARGQREGKVREKVVEVEEMLQIIQAGKA